MIVETRSVSLLTLKWVLWLLKQISEMKSEIGKLTNSESGRRPTFISSVLSDWFTQSSTRPLIGRNFRHCSWLKLFFWGRRKQCEISFLGLFSKVRGFEFTSWGGNEIYDRQSHWNKKYLLCLFTFAESSEPVRIPGRGWARAATASARLHAQEILLTNCPTTVGILLSFDLLSPRTPSP